MEFSITASGFIVNTAGDKKLRAVVKLMITKRIYFLFLPIEACDSLKWSKFNRVIAMDMSEERVKMIVSAIGRVVMDLSLAYQPAIHQSIKENWSYNAEKHAM
ncbi:hypothetical protein [Atlantibacter hermannii]|uniref:hypothetical protein n=1 Tax=Atlantibacter hermannii TaxID=565 RepID=UPI0028A811C9|nr:hypothetical protein [Atlantibacter hermannii]